MNCEPSTEIFRLRLFSVIDAFELFWMKGSILGPTLFLLYIYDHPDDVICNIAIYADGTLLNSKCDQTSDVWQQLELAYKLESDI